MQVLIPLLLLLLQVLRTDRCSHDTGMHQVWVLLLLRVVRMGRCSHDTGTHHLYTGSHHTHLVHRHRHRHLLLALVLHPHHIPHPPLLPPLT
jgi:hypothetical protein